MIPYYERNGITIYSGDCLEVMPELDLVFDAVIADPPYFGIVKETWDRQWDSTADYVQVMEISEDYCRIAVERLRQPSFFSMPDKPKTVKFEQAQLNV